MTSAPVVRPLAAALPPRSLTRFCRKPSRVGAPDDALLPAGLMALIKDWKSLWSLASGLAGAVVAEVAELAVLVAAAEAVPVPVLADVLAAVLAAVPAVEPAAPVLAAEPLLAPLADVSAVIRFCNWLRMELPPP